MPHKSHGMPRPRTKMLGAILTSLIDMIMVRKKTEVNVRGEEKTNIKI